MKQAFFLLPVALAAAYVTPSKEQNILSVSIDDGTNTPAAVSSFWDEIIQGDDFKAVSDTFEHALRDAHMTLSHVFDGDEGPYDDNDDDDHHDHDGDHGHHGHHHGDPSKTIYELISESKYTKRFAALVDEHDSIKDLLQDTEANHTLFVWTDRAFERLPDHGKGKKKPPADFIRAALTYTVAPGLWPARRLYYSHTVPSSLNLSSLDDHPQRLRIDASLLFGIRVNFLSKIVARDIVAKNGLIQAVDFILAPPPPTAKILQLLPDSFSTLSLALETTGLGAELADEVAPYAKGGTFFAATNRAFRRLGPRANAFLFSDHGKKYLKALVKYSIVANETLYSDAYYKHHEDDDDSDAETAAGYWHVDLPSLLDDKHISVDVKRWKGWVSIVANGYTRVAAPDILASDGVLQIVNSVLIPPHPHRGLGIEESKEKREWEVEELKERLEPLLEKDDDGWRDL